LPGNLSWQSRRFMFDTGFMPAIGVTIGQSATCHAHAMRLKTPRRAWGRHSRYYSL
jgi:hypothetical protein